MWENLGVCGVMCVYVRICVCAIIYWVEFYLSGTPSLKFSSHGILEDFNAPYSCFFTWLCRFLYYFITAKLFLKFLCLFLLCFLRSFTDRHQQLQIDLKLESSNHF